ncbi:MAG: winged helix-turn-helix domain-containing protein [Candidatus Omnitrophica bacterium]|nr:winged helix-turn-helix domain-containing protein [Candidatus Omnitrophota bacterium]
MITEIGIIAGAILEFLEEKQSPVSITEIKLHLDEPRDLINMAIGWLIRENYVHIVRDGQEYFVFSKEPSFSKIFEKCLCAK